MMLYTCVATLLTYIQYTPSVFVPVASLIACADAPGHDAEDPMMHAAAAAGVGVDTPTKRDRKSAPTAITAERMRKFTGAFPIS